MSQATSFRQRSRREGMSFMLSLGLVASASASFADPDFSSVSDILGGKKYLLRQDDLVFTSTQIGTSQHQTAIATLYSANSTLAFRQTVPWGVAGGGVNYAQGNSRTAVGRMFNLPYDVVATFTQPDAINPTGVNVYDPGTGTVNFYRLPYNSFEAVDSTDGAVMADFTGDGYADLVTLATSPGMFGGAAITLATAADVTNVGAGLTFGAATIVTPNPQPFAGGTPMTVGDFNGDGLPEIALVTCPQSACSVQILAVDPNTLAVSMKSTITLPEFTSGTASLAAGRFGATDHDQLVVAYQPASGNAIVASIDFDASLQPSLKAVSQDITGSGGFFFVKADRLDWFSPYDYAVLVGGNNIQILGFTTDGNLTPGIKGPGLAIVGCVTDVAVGNFNNTTTNPKPPPATTINPDLQIAVLTNNQCDGGIAGDIAVSIYFVDDQFEPFLASTYELPSKAMPPTSAGLYQNLAVGDLQGRSLPLGPPSKVTIQSHIQPDVVLGIPPMHIDWINPVLPGNTPGLPAACQNAPMPCVLNLTVVPSLPAPAVGFSTQYSFSQGASVSATRKNTTSYSFSTKESVSSKLSYGIPSDNVSIAAKLNAKQTHDNSVAASFNTYSGKTDSLTSTTGFSDHVFYTESRFNLYYYPVLGQTICPAANPGCSASERVPLQVVFSGPDMVDHTDIDATTQEWYQPIQEPGNVFSYPWTVPILQQSLPNLAALTGDPSNPNWRGTDTSNSSYSTTWQQGSGNSQTSGSVSTHSIDASVSVSGKASIGFVSGSGSVGFEVNNSTSTSTLNTSTQTLTSSTGIQANKPAFNGLVAGSYLYDFAGYVFGQTSPAGTIQTIPLASGGSPTQIQTTGPLTVAYVADPLRAGIPWWLQAYTKPDVGLSHPERWDWSKSTQVASFNPPDQASAFPQDEPFYHIKGLFITPADASGIGPQVTNATAGDVLQLTARVYNYSLADMPAGTQVHAQFYGQVYENKQLVGASFLIGEAVINPICASQSQAQTCNGAPNWAFASTTFNTASFAQTKGGDVNVIFWAVVWMQNAQGDAVAELPGHGLSSGFTPPSCPLPPPLCPGDPRTSTGYAQITDVPVEAYSNNVGFYGYNTPLHIAAPGAGATLPGVPSKPGDLKIVRFGVDDLSIRRGKTRPRMPTLELDKKSKLLVSLRTGSLPLGRLPIHFYDGDPKRGGQLFDIQHLNYLRPNATETTRVFYRPETCGKHTIFAVAAPATRAPDKAKFTVEVDVDEFAQVQSLIVTTRSLSLPRHLLSDLVKKLAKAERAFGKGNDHAGKSAMQNFIRSVQRQRGRSISTWDANVLIGKATLIIACV